MRLFARMRLMLFTFAVLLALASPASAMVGGAPAATAETGERHAVLIVGSRGNSCTGTAIARDLVLTAAHCVAPGADYKLVEFDAARQPVLKDVAQIARHPQFSLASLNGHRATADVALLKLAAPLPARLAPAALAHGTATAKPGDRFIVAGFGVTRRGDGRSGGTLRSAALEATGRPGSLQLRLFDPATRNMRAGLGACTGDSGAPVFQANGGALALIGVVSWSTAANNAAGCGGLTGVTPLTRYRAWIVETGRRLGAAGVPETIVAPHERR
jgi:secreted trypsin-like serine protease